jgi:UrcA family protein
MSITLSRLSLAALVLASAPAFVRPVHAAEAPQPFSHPVTLVVSTHGLNLASPADQAKMRQRVEVAARRVCQEVISEMPHGEGQMQACIDDTLPTAWGFAQAKIDEAVQHSMFAAAKP